MNETLAIECAHQAIAYIAGSENALNALMAQSGLSAGDFRDQIYDPAFLAGILDFLFQNEDLFLDFCSEIKANPDNVIRLRRSLPGAENLWDS